MRVTLTIVADVDPVGLARYIAQYPGFAGDGPAEILATEAICAWENEGLLVEGSDPEVTAFEVLDTPEPVQTWRPKHEL